MWSLALPSGPRIWPGSGPYIQPPAPAAWPGSATPNPVSRAPIQEQHVSDEDNDQTSQEDTPDTAFLSYADVLDELDASAGDAAVGVGEVDGSPSGSALVVVKRGPTAGSRFLLDQPVTSAGRHPGSDIFLEDITISRRHAEIRRENGEFRIVDTGSLNSTYVNRKPVGSAVLANGDEIQDRQVQSGVPHQAHD
jgi:pSer/pThr/pTyr-binding forkhead associated (FHA) protein